MDIFVKNEIYVAKLRDVKIPSRANSTDAGLDCYLPKVDEQFLEDLYSLNKKNGTALYINLHCVVNNEVYTQTVSFNDIMKIDESIEEYQEHQCIRDFLWSNMVADLYDNHIDVHNIPEDKVKLYYTFTLPAHSRVLFPGGIKTTLFPKSSALIACNKSGIATSKGLVFTCHVIDSFYTGEVCYGVANISDCDVVIEPEKKLLQVLHTPVFITTPTEISMELYNFITKDSDRGEGGFGSSGLK